MQCPEPGLAGGEAVGLGGDMIKLVLAVLSLMSSWDIQIGMSGWSNKREAWEMVTDRQ